VQTRARVANNRKSVNTTAPPAALAHEILSVFFSVSRQANASETKGNYGLKTCKIPQCAAQYGAEAQLHGCGT
jgi:hypothetical protein